MPWALLEGHAPIFEQMLDSLYKIDAATAESVRVFVAADRPGSEPADRSVGRRIQPRRSVGFDGDRCLFVHRH